MPAPRRYLTLLVAAILLVCTPTAGHAAQSGEDQPTPEEVVRTLAVVLEQSISAAPEVVDPTKVNARTGEPGEDGLPGIGRAIQTTVQLPDGMAPIVIGGALAAAAPGAWTVHAPGSGYYTNAQDSLALILMELDQPLTCAGAFVSAGYYAYGQGGNEFAQNPEFPFGSGVGANTAGSFTCVDDEITPTFALPDETGASQQATSPLVSGVAPTTRDTSIAFFLLPFPVEWTASISGIEDIATADPATATVLEWSSPERSFLSDHLYELQFRASVSDQPGTGLVVVDTLTGEEVEGVGLLDTLDGLGELPDETGSATDDAASPQAEDPDDQDDAPQEDAEPVDDLVDPDASGVDEDSGSTAIWWWLGGAAIAALMIAAFAKYNPFGRWIAGPGPAVPATDPEDPTTWAPVAQDPLLSTDGLFRRAAALALERGGATVVAGHVIPPDEIWDEVLADHGLDDWTHHVLSPALAYARGQDLDAVLPGYEAKVDVSGTDGRVWIHWPTRVEQPDGTETEADLHIGIDAVRNGRIAIDPATGEARWCPERAWNRVAAPRGVEGNDTMMGPVGDDVIPS